VKHIVAPSYPPIARQARVQGTVSVELQLGPDGKVISAKGSGADEILNGAAEYFIKEWVFAPVAGDSARTTTFTFVFVLKNVNDNSLPHPGVVFDLPDRVEIIGTFLLPSELNQ
jgi:TonB family protein